LRNQIWWTHGESHPGLPRARRVLCY